LQPKLNEDGFYLEGISDSEYAGDPGTRISVYGYVLYFCGEPIAWKSKAGKSITLSSTEAEYYATSEIAKEVTFAKNMLEEVGIQIQFTIKILCNSVGATYLANNHCNSQRTKHIDTRQQFVREWVEDDILKMNFTPTLKNTADIFTKNTSAEIFNTH
jgi:di/tripeptidase